MQKALPDEQLQGDDRLVSAKRWGVTGDWE